MNNRLKLRITGKTKKHLLNEIIKKRINIYNLEESDNKYEIIIDKKDYDDLLNIKTTNKIKIIERIGLNKYISFIKNNYLILIFILIGVLLNFLLSNLVLDIDIVHSNKEIKKIIKEDLTKFGIKKYKFKKTYEEKEIIKDKILDKEKDKIEWLEIEEKGTKYIIKVEERKIKTTDTCTPRHIVSNKKAIITKITSESGEIIKKINDYVVPGDILISGIIYNKETAVDKKCAIGKVYGETWYKVKVVLDKKYTTYKETNNHKKGLKIKIFDYEYELFNIFSNYKIHEYNIIESKIIPLKISFASYQEVDELKKTNTISNVDEKALTVAESRIIKTLSNDEKVLSKKVLKKTLKNSKIEVEIFISTEENITAYQDITNININDLNKE